MLHTEESKVKQYLSKYQNPESTRKDVMNVVSQYRGLSCKLEPYDVHNRSTVLSAFSIEEGACILRLQYDAKGQMKLQATEVFNDGTNKDLLKMEGTIPVTYKVFSNGASKNFVQIQGTIPVSYRGSVYNIPVCIYLMDTHPANPPICYVKPTPDMQIKVSEYVDQSGKVYLPYLHEWTPASSDLLGLIQVMIVVFGEKPPVYARTRNDTMATPYPTQPTPYMPMPGSSGSNTNSTPYPPYPTTTPYPAHPTNYPTNFYPPYPQTGTSSYPTYPSYPPSGSAYPYSTPSYPPYGHQQTSQTGTPTPGPPGSATSTITEEHIRASLLSAVEDKLRRRLREQFSQTQAELETLKRTQLELTQGKSKLDNLLSRLEREQEELDKYIAILKDKGLELEKAIERVSEQEQIDVDEAVTTTAPLYKQLLNAFAEEAATEDAIYYMGEALRRGVIDLDVFLKQVRSLSRKQFMLRALMHKCRQKAGLAG